MKNFFANWFSKRPKPNNESSPLFDVLQSINFPVKPSISVNELMDILYSDMDDREKASFVWDAAFSWHRNKDFDIANEFLNKLDVSRVSDQIASTVICGLSSMKHLKNYPVYRDKLYDKLLKNKSKKEANDLIRNF